MMDEKAEAPTFIDHRKVRALLSPAECFDAVRDGMLDLATGTTRQTLRTVIDLGAQRAFGIMPGALAVDGFFGAKLVSVMPAGNAAGRSRHRGIIALFNPPGDVVAIIDAEEITSLRTAAASAVATDALARSNARRLALIGAGEQAERHAVAIARIRPLDAITLWSRNEARADRLAKRLRETLGAAVGVSASVAEAVRTADIVCTLTGAAEPILFGRDVAEGTHINAVGSSVPASAEIDGELVSRSRFIADSAEGVRAQGGEWRRALASGAVGEDHLAGEIGDVLSGRIKGRTHAKQITIYKSLGHVVQDLAAAVLVYRKSTGRA